MSSKNNFESKHLLSLIGQQVVYQEKKCEIIELLDGCNIVLQVLESGTNIQATQYGEGHRDVPVTHILPIFDGAGELHIEMGLIGVDTFLETKLNA